MNSGRAVADQIAGKILLEAEGLSLAAPFRRHIAKPTDSHSMGQFTLDRRFDEVGREEGKRDHHVDLPCGASLTLGDAVRIHGWISKPFEPGQSGNPAGRPPGIPDLATRMPGAVGGVR